MSENENNFKIKVVGTTGISYMILVESSEKIRDLKIKIAEKVGISSQVFDLSWCGKILNDDNLISDYNLCSSDVIHCIENTLGGKIKIK